MPPGGFSAKEGARRLVAEDGLVAGAEAVPEILSKFGRNGWIAEMRVAADIGRQADSDVMPGGCNSILIALSSHLGEYSRWRRWFIDNHGSMCTAGQSKGRKQYRKQKESFHV